MAHEVHLQKKLKDVLEENVPDKYFLSEKMVEWITQHREKRDSKNESPMNEEKYSSCITSRYNKQGAEDPYVKIKSATSKGYEVATENDSINFSVPNSETRRGRVGKEVAQTLDTQCNQGVMVGTWRTHKDGQGFREIEDGNCPTIPARAREDGSGQPVICVPLLTPNRVEKRQNGRRFKEDGEPAFTVTTQDQHGIYDGFKIRRLTPCECFRLMDFPDTFTWNVSDSQAYKQAGNSICVGVLAGIINGMKKLHKE